MKRKSRKRRYLCDRISTWFSRYGSIMMLLFFLAYFAICFLLSKVLLTEFKDYFNTYPESDYQYLNTVIDNAVDPSTKQIAFENVPNDVIISKGEENNTYKFQTMKRAYVITPTVLVEITNNISKTYLDSNEYIKQLKFSVISILWTVILFIGLIGLFLLLLPIFFISWLSRLHKLIVTI